MTVKAIKTKAALLSAVLAAVMIVTALLGGCTLFDLDDYYAEFTKSKINVSVGDTYELRSVIRSNVSYTVTSSNPTIADVSGTLLTAYSTGTATLTLSSYDTADDVMRVVVAEDGLTIEYDGELVQTVGQSEEIIFRVNATGSVADGRIYWYVDDMRMAIRNSNESFSYRPGVGETVITAKCATNFNYSDSVTVRSYFSVQASGTVSGELVQVGDITPLTLRAEISNGLNPENYIEWREDGKPVYVGSETEVKYTPSAGRHTIELYVNGVKRTVNGEDSVTVACSGSVVPTDIEVVFDNMYPHLYIRADVQGGMQVEITQPNGTVGAYSQKTHAALFDENGFDAASFIRLCANVNPMTYEIRVKSLGDGDLLAESAYSAPVEFKQLPAAAKPYIENIYHNKDHYLTSDEEYVNAFEYYVITRSKTSVRPRIQFDCYVGYDMKYTAEQLWNYAFRIGATSGNYTGRGATLSDDGKIIKTDMTVNTVNNPNKQSYGSYGYSYNSELHSNIPHINYDIAKYRPANYVYPIDLLEHTASVRYTDELYLAAQNGTKPVPVFGSAAYTVYNMARNILRQIISDDMTDKQKAHAIYDWIMWQVTYDTPATMVSSNGEAYSAYYLEGVFGDMATPIDGVVYYPFAVCDGMSKAYSLMCNIEGIPCVRVSGMAGSSASAAGGHAWNKVFIDGEWYIVDCTWGDSVTSKGIGGVYGDYEMGLHDWLFVTDEQAESTHFEPYTYEKHNPKWGISEIVYAPRTAKKPLSPYVDMEYNGVTINCEVASGESQRDRVTEIMTEYASAFKKRNMLYVPGVTGAYYNIAYQSVEIHFENGCNMTSSSLSSTIKSAVQKKLPDAQMEILQYGQIVLVLINNR